MSIVSLEIMLDVEKKMLTCFLVILYAYFTLVCIIIQAFTEHDVESLHLSSFCMLVWEIFEFYGSMFEF